MPRFFIDTPPTSQEVLITGDDAWHIGRSLRMRVGDNLTVCCQKVDYFCEILSITQENVRLSVKSQSPSAEPSISLFVYIALPKLDKLELIAQKCTELGASKIIPVLTKRCVSRPDEKQFEKKRERLQKIVLEASKQSGRGIIPEVSEILSLKDAVKEMSEHNISFVCYEKGGAPLSSFEIKSGCSVGLFTGAEGGFEEEEIALCESVGIKKIHLGSRILRCETAPISASSIIMHISGNM